MKETSCEDVRSLFGESAGWLVGKRASASGISALGCLYGRCREKVVMCGAGSLSEFGQIRIISDSFAPSVPPLPP